MARYRPAAGAKEAKTRGTPTKSRAAKGKTYGGRVMRRVAGGEVPYMGGRGRGGRGLPESEQVRTKLVKRIDRLTGQINKMEQQAIDPKNVKKIQRRKSSRKIA